MDEDIVINVEFEGGNLPVPNAGNVQVVPANIAWEDFELMVGFILLSIIFCFFKWFKRRYE